MSGKFKALLLDMNHTFMFGGDRFGPGEDFYLRYKELGGSDLDSDTVNSIIRKVYDKLLQIYPDPVYRENFPKVRDTIEGLTSYAQISDHDIQLLTQTFSHHELGHVPFDFVEAVTKLSKRYRLALVADIWSEKTPWLDELSKSGLTDLFEVMSFSSDSGIVKPSPKPFLEVLSIMRLSPKEALVVGDSVRRDLGGAAAASIACILVGGASHPDCYGSVTDLIELSEDYEPRASKNF